MTRNLNVLLAVAAVAAAMLACSNGGAVSACAFAIDSINAIPKTTFECLVGQGYEAFFGRIQRGTGGYDNVGVQNIVNARAGGFASSDAYIVPCFAGACATPRRQAMDSIENMSNGGASIGRAYVRVRQMDNWPASTASNQDFLTKMVNGIRAAGAQAGVLTNEADWNVIMGAGYATPAPTAGGTVTLWWSDTTNGDKGFIGLNKNQIGGWLKPAMHQYLIEYSLECSAGSGNVTYYD